MTSEEMEKAILSEIDADPEAFSETSVCTIDPNTRVITVPASLSVFGTESDEKTNRIPFRCPMVVGDNVDLSNFQICINFRNANSEKDRYIVEDMMIDGDEITFSWSLSRKVTKYKGKVSFIVCALNAREGTIVNEWNTTLAFGTVLEGLEADEVNPDEEEKDIILQLLAMVDAKSNKALEEIEAAKNEAVKEVQSYGGVLVDQNLENEGQAADAKVTGDKITQLRGDLVDLEYSLHRVRLTSSDLVWEIGKNINSDGNIVERSSTAISGSYAPMFKKIYVNELVYGLNNYPYTIGVAEYSNGVFKRRTFISGDGETNYSVELENDTTEIRFIVGYVASTGVAFSQTDLQYFYAINIDYKSIFERIEDLESNTVKDKIKLTSSDLVWEIGKNISSDGNIAENRCKAISGNYSININDNKYIRSKNINIKDDNGVDISICVAEYSNGVFKRRTCISGDGKRVNSIKLRWDTDAIRFTIGRLSSTNIGFVDTDLKYFSVDVVTEPIKCDLTNLQPLCVGELNAVKRARQLTDIKWTPLFDIPRLSMMGGDDEETYPDTSPVFEDVFKAGVEYTGIPYTRAGNDASPYGYGTFKVGFASTIGGFITSIRNKNSHLAKKSVFDSANNSACNIGCVCSSLVSYALDLDDYAYTSSMADVSGMTLLGKVVDNGTRFDLAQLHLGDVLLNPSIHTAIVTDVIKDENDAIIQIEISEATCTGNDNWNVSLESDGGGGQLGGVCRRRVWEIDDFFANWSTYKFYRYSNIKYVPYTPSPYVQIGDERKIRALVDLPCMPYLGNEFKYKKDYIPNTKILVSATGLDKMRVLKDGVAWNSNGTQDYYTVNGDYVDVGFSEVGEYKAYLCKIENGSETIRTKTCTWSVINEGMSN